MEGIRLMRRFLAGLVVSLAAVLLPVSTASADELGTVTGVTAEVNARTPLYHLELTFTLTDVQCPAVIDYEMGGTTRSATVDQCVSDPGGFYADATATTMRAMFGPGLGTINPRGTACDDGAEVDGPGCQVSVVVRHADDDVTTDGQQVLTDGDGAPIEVPIPPRPVWVGIGDGYTSRTTQMADWCYEDSTDAAQAGADALATGVTTSTSGDDVICSANSVYFNEETGGFEYYHPVTLDNFWFDDENDELFTYDGDGVRILASEVTPYEYEDPDTGEIVVDDDITLDDLEPEMGGLTHYTTTHDMSDQSWINAVVQNFNREYVVGATDDTPGSNIPCDDESDDSRCWKVVPEVVADADVTAVELAEGGADPTGQLSQLEALLTSERHWGSWNWVGMSAGLVDAGIPQAIQDEYPTDTDGSYLYEPLDGTGYVPWRPAGGDPCPALPEVTGTIQAGITDGITNTLNKAMEWSPGLKAIVVRYPWLTEVTSTATSAQNPCATDGDGDGTPDNREPIQAINDAVDAALAEFPVGDDVFVLNLAAELDLEDGFSDEPTDSVPDRPSFLQLTRPVGYPYPSDYGSSTMGRDAFESIEESGVTPPSIEGVVVQADDDDPSSPSTVADSLRNALGWFRSQDLYVEWRATAPEGISTLSRRSPLERGANRTYTGSVVDSVNQMATATVTASWDPDAPTVSSTLSGATVNSAGWYRARPTITWVVRDDVNRSLYPDGSPPSGVDQVPPSVSSYPDGKGVVVTSGTATDVAGNTATGTRTLNVDTVNPTLRGTVSPSGWSNASSATVTWERYDATSGVRTSINDTVGIVGQTDYVTNTVSKEGQTAVSHTVYDVASNSTTESVEVRLDRTAPDVEVVGIPPGATTTVDQLESVIAGITCNVTNVPKGSVNAVSPIEQQTGPTMTTTPGNGGLNYTFVCYAKDQAGNETTRTRSFFVEVDDPPTIAGEYASPANGAGWWNQNVQIDWTGTPAPGWGLHPFLGALHGGSWAIDSDGVGRRSSIHTTEGIYDVVSPTACHSPQPGGTCAPTITKNVKLDKTPPRVDPATSGGTLGGGGWYRSGPISVSWLVGDVVPTGLTADQVSGVASSSLPGTTVSQQGVTTVSSGTVSDRAGNTATGSKEIKIDAKAPTITTVDGVTDGAVYTFLDQPDVNDVTCTAVDEPPSPGVQVSGVDAAGCRVGVVGNTPIGGLYGPPINQVVWQASVSDIAGNPANQSVTTRVLQFTPGLRGRMTVGGDLQTSTYGKVSTSGTLRCNGSPNNLTVQWNGGKFTLNWIDYFYCWDQGDLEGNPDAPIDTLFGVGKGKLANGQDATIEWTMGDRGEPAKGNDTLQVLIKNASGQTVLNAAGLLTGGNFQAHDAQGNGTNNNGNVNGPTGNTSNQSAPLAQSADVVLLALLPERPKVH